IDAHGDREVDGTGKSLAFGVAMGGGDAVDDPGYMDDTPPDSPVRTLHNAASEQSRGEDQALQGTDRDLCNRAPMPTVPIAVEDEKSQRLPQKPLNTIPTHPSLPSKPPAAWNSSTSGASGSNVGRAGGSDNDLWKLRKGVRNETGDIAYYDPSFVEDPWQELLGNHVRMDKG
ncbi:MAG: hypothetical protein M1830_000844, partial [Pleopsidium flavum]